MVPSLRSGILIAPPARCIHRPQRDTSSAGYRLLVSRASVGASRELSSRRSPAIAPHTCAISPTFRYGAFLFVALALAAVPLARLTACVLGRASIRHQSDSNRLCRPNWGSQRYHRYQTTTRQIYCALSQNRTNSAMHIALRQPLCYNVAHDIRMPLLPCRN